jgi:opacity protein-like surface antigen
MIAKLFWGLAVLALCTAPAMAGDFGGDGEEAVIAETPTSRVYIRADLSYAWQKAMDAEHFAIGHDDYRYVDATDDREMEDTVGVGIGAGMRFGHNLRGDVTVDLRQKAHAESLSLNAWQSGILYGDAKVQSTVVLANLYYDFARGGTITPYVGAGIGLSHNDTSRPFVVDLHGHPFDFDGKSKTDFAWALMAGVSKNLGGMEIDLGYHFLNMGDAQFDLHPTCYCAKQVGVDILDMTAHEIRLGLRYNIH